MSQYRILVVDDEEDICEILHFNLEAEGYLVDVAYSAEEALEKDLSVYSLLLLDVMMGTISGFEMANKVRKNDITSNIPFIFLTAKTDENNRLKGLRVGADDYIFKPFSLREVIERIKAVIIRLEVTKYFDYQFLSYEKLEMNLIDNKVMVDKMDVLCTKKEFEILKLFLENKNRMFTEEELQLRIWMNEEPAGLDGTIDRNINQLRKKIGRYEKNIVNRHGYGYSFEEL